MASIDSLKASDGSGNASVATVQNTRSAGATTIIVDTVQGINTNFHASMGTPHTFTDPVTGEDITIISEATAVDFKGHVDGTNLEIDTIAPGYTDAGSAVGDIVIIKPTTQRANEVAEVLEVAHSDDGNIATDTIAEKTAAAGVTIDGLLIKDGHIDNGGVLGDIEYFTSSGTWTKPSGLKFVIVEVQGGGGGSGGCASTGASPAGASSGGGGGGGYARKKILAAALAATETVTVGAAGAAGASGNNTGGAGGTSSFGSHASAAGGGGGAGGAGTGGTTSAQGGTGGSGSSGDMNAAGSGGGSGFVYAGQHLTTNTGGNSVLGGGGIVNGGGRLYGGGGGGRILNASSAAQPGHVGAAGIVIVHEYF